MFWVCNFSLNFCTSHFKKWHHREKLPQGRKEKKKCYCVLFIKQIIPIQEHFHDGIFMCACAFSVDLGFEPVTCFITFPASGARSLSSAPSSLTNSNGFIISAAGSVSVPRWTWKRKLSTWSSLHVRLRLQASGGAFTVALTLVKSHVAGQSFFYSKMGLCQSGAGSEDLCSSNFQFVKKYKNKHAKTW